MRSGLPFVMPGQVVGLLGGSFDPAHAGHVHITLEALRRFGLDRVWWMVSPGNPLKVRGPASMGRRMARARALMVHPRVTVTDVEARLGTRYTAQTLAALQALYPRVRFVWLMGADNLAQFHRWQDWRDIMARVPVGVLARPGGRIAARTSPAAQTFRQYRVRAGRVHGLGRMTPPAWAFANVPMHAASSTAIRAGGEWI
jgi:nicotinate-nucleotide adenylyltransferase